jgi:uncharacterized protein (DUF952 family)
MKNLNNWIVHMCSASAWEEAIKEGEYSAESLISEGFIHFSKPDQLLVVANNFYHGRSDLVLLWVDPEMLKANLMYDSVGSTVFPHLYGKLNLDAVQAVSDFSPDADGNFRKLPDPDDTSN